MLSSSPRFKELIRIHQIPTEPKPCPYGTTNSNFQEFRKVYSEKKISYKCSPFKPPSIRPKTQLHTIKLEMPLLGSEQAIVSVPVLKKNALKSIMKKTTSTPTRTTPKELVKKLSKMEREQIKTKSPRPSRTPSLDIIEKTNKEIEIAAEQLRKIREMIQIKQNFRPSRKNSIVYKINTKNSPRIRHTNCFNTSHRSTLNSLQQKVQHLEQKYFSKPQIVYKSIHDSFTQSSDIEILYENKAFPEDMKMDQALKGIINELDDLVNVNIEEKFLSSLGSEDEDYNRSTTSNETACENIKTSEFKDFPQNKFELAENLNQIFKYGRQSLNSKQSLVRKNGSLTSTNSDSVKMTQRTKKKVSFEDTIPEDYAITKQNITTTSENSNLPLDKMYRNNLSSFDEPVTKKDSIFSLLDDTKIHLDEFLALKKQMHVRSENEKHSVRNTINDMEKFVKEKRIYDERKRVEDQSDKDILNIIQRMRNKSVHNESHFENQQPNQAVTVGSKIDNEDNSIEKGTKEEGVQIENNIRDIIDSSEALVKKIRKIKGNVLSVGEFCDNLTRITETEEEGLCDIQANPRPFNFHDGSGDEGDSVEIDDEDLPSSVKKSSFLMKEFNITPKVKVFSQSGNVISNRSRRIDDNTTSSSNKFGIDMRSLKTSVNYALENSLFSNVEL